MTKSKILRRSGNAVVQYCQLIDFEPKFVALVGVGMRHQEIDVMREAWPELSVYGFEPNPQTFQRIEKSFPGMLWESAISDFVGIREFYFNKDGSSLFQSLTKENKSEFVDVTTLNRVFNWGNLQNGLLWLDCEGSELNALRGATRVIGSFDVINVEMTGRPRGDGWSSPKDVHDWLVEFGFKRAWIHTTRSVVGQYDAIYVRKELLHSDLCCCPCSLEEDCK